MMKITMLLILCGALISGSASADTYTGPTPNVTATQDYVLLQGHQQIITFGKTITLVPMGIAYHSVPIHAHMQIFSKHVPTRATHRLSA